MRGHRRRIRNALVQIYHHTMKQLPPFLFMIQGTPTILLTLIYVRPGTLRDKQCETRNTTAATETPRRDTSDRLTT